MCSCLVALAHKHAALLLTYCLCCLVFICRGSEGGGLYAASSAGRNFQLVLDSTHISSNEAHTGGGLFLKSGDTHIGPGTVISHNQALQQAGGVGWVGGCSSGQVCQSVLNISCDAKVVENKAAVAGGGLFVGQEFNTHLDASTDCAMKAVRNNSAAFGEANVFFVRSTCKPGEVSKGGWCEFCPPNMYAFELYASKCEICPGHATCLGGDKLLPDAGFWHSSSKSTQIRGCPNPAACNHTLDAANAYAPVDWQCSAGYQGRVCGSCVEGYGFTTPFKCGNCLSSGKTLALYTTALSCLVTFLCCSSHTTFKDNQQQRTAQRVSDTIKTLVLHLNYVVIFSSLRVDWPKSLSILYVATAWLLSSSTGEVLSLDCMLPGSGPLPLVIRRTLIYLFVPVVVTAAVLLAFVISWAIAPLLCRRRRPSAFRARVAVKFPTALLVCLYLFFPSLVRVAWGMFACLKLDEAGKLPFAQYAVATAPFGYWVQDMQQACYEGWHLGWSLGLGLVCILLFCIGVPAGLFVWLLTHRSQLSEPGFQMHYGFLYADFKADKYYREALITARTVLLVCVAVFSSVFGPYYGVVMFVVIFHVCLVLQLAVCPFAFAQLHRIQLAALGCLDLTGCVTLTFFTVGFDTVSHAVSIYKEVAGALLLVVHAVFICWCLWVMVAGLPLQRVSAGVSSAWQHASACASKVRRNRIRTALYCCSAKVANDCALPAPLAGAASAGMRQQLSAGPLKGSAARAATAVYEYIPCAVLRSCILSCLLDRLVCFLSAHNQL